MRRRIYQTFLAFFTLTLPRLAFAAEELLGQPTPGAIDFQRAASPVKRIMHDFHNYNLLPIIIGISVLVLGLMIWVTVRFNRRANPVPSRTTHNTLLEFVWTLLPLVLLVVILVPSLKLLYFAERAPQTELTLKVIGHQWYWEYEYPDHNNIKITAYPKADKDRLPGEPRLLETDNRITLPVNTPIKVDVTAADVLHSWALPAFGVKKDAVPGRLNTTWLEIEQEGVYYGQCSELCGTGHGYMPIAINAVSKEAFAAWVAGQQQEQGLVPAANTAPAAPTALPAKDAQNADQPAGATTKGPGAPDGNKPPAAESEPNTNETSAIPQANNTQAPNE